MRLQGEFFCLGTSLLHLFFTCYVNKDMFLYRFVPSINGIIYHGNKTERDEIRKKHMPKKVGPEFPIIITSYEVAMNDSRRCLRHYNWKYVIVDEVSYLATNYIIFLHLELTHPDTSLHDLCTFPNLCNSHISSSGDYSVFYLHFFFLVLEGSSTEKFKMQITERTKVVAYGKQASTYWNTSAKQPG